MNLSGTSSLVSQTYVSLSAFRDFVWISALQSLWLGFSSAFNQLLLYMLGRISEDVSKFIYIKLRNHGNGGFYKEKFSWGQITMSRYETIPHALLQTYSSVLRPVITVITRNTSEIHPESLLTLIRAYRKENA